MIQVTQLSKKYSGNTVLNIEELTIPKGQTFGLVGNNGAGKTTFFNLLLDLINPTTGKIINKEIQVNVSEDWKPFTAAFIDESFLIEILLDINDPTEPCGLFFILSENFGEQIIPPVSV